MKEEIRLRLRTQLPGKPALEKAAAQAAAESEMWSFFRPVCEKLELEQEAAKEAVRRAKAEVEEAKEAAKQEREAAKQEKASSGGKSSSDDRELVLSYQDLDIDSLLDPHYSETVPARWIRDGLIWVAAEFRRVVSDSPDQSTINLHQAKVPPPTPWAIFVLESFARRNPAKRADLISRVLSFASKSTPSTEQAAQIAESGDLDFLDSIS
jgi:hypothetical protein